MHKITKNRVESFKVDYVFKFIVSETFKQFSNKITVYMCHSLTSSLFLFYFFIYYSLK